MELKIRNLCFALLAALPIGAAAQTTVPPFDVPWFSLGGIKPDTGYCPVGVSPTEVRWSLCNFSSVPTPIPLNKGGTGATTAAGANLNITGVTQTGTLGTSSQVSTFPGTVAAGATTTATRTIDCAGYSTLALCWAAAQTYVTTNETGSGHAVELLLHDQTYSTGGTTLQVYSGMQIVGVQPRLAANGSQIWAQPTPNGGTWIDCGTAPCLSGGNSSGLTGVVLKNLGFENFTNVATFGGSGVNGLSNSLIEQVYMIGAATCCAADTGIVDYNFNFLQVQGLYGYNINTCSDFENSSPVGLYSGNSNIYDDYCYTYPKSVANSNNAKPGMKIGGGSNLIIAYRPQVLTPGGDSTGIGIEFSNTAYNYVFGGDTEGSLLHGVLFTGNSSGNTYEMAIGTGTTDANFIQLDSGSVNNTVRTSNPNWGFTLSGTALGKNFMYAPGFIGNGDVGITFNDAYGNAVLIGNGSWGDNSGALSAANLAFTQSGGATYVTAAGKLQTVATTSQIFGAYGSALLGLQTDPVITADNAFEPTAPNSVDLGGYTLGWRHGFLEHLDQAIESGAPQYAGQCTIAGTPATTCTITIQHAYTYGSLCFTSPFAPYTGTGQAACNLSGTTITITTPVAIATSLGWNAFIVGNPY